MVQRMDSRLSAIENGISMLPGIESELNKMRSDIKSIKVDGAKVNQQLGDLDTFCQSISDTIDEFHSHTVYCTKTTSELKGQNSSLRETL